MSQLPCDADGICMLCKTKPSDTEKLTCNTCVTPWHASCLLLPPETLASTLQWDCPDCTTLCSGPVLPAVGTGGSDELVNAIRAIEADDSLNDREKAKKRQDLLTGKSDSPDLDGNGKDKDEGGNDVLAILGDNFKCSFCMQLPERPVTTPCGHNFCLTCFQKWIREGKRTCVKCRGIIPPKMASQPRINSSLVEAIRMARMSKSIVSGGSQRVYQYIHNQDRPDKAFTSERAKKAGMANASSGRIFVTVPGDHFGPILAENDPIRKQGVLVGESWELRMECRQWGIHYPPVAGIAGQSDYGAQSVVLSGGYEDDEDHGEWFLYTGSGGRDLSGNKRTNKDQSFDQKFDASNEALRVSCKKGYPVRVVRSFKEKRSSYAPEKGLRYDGIYRIEKCWRKDGKQGFKVCRYLFVRCDNEPAPWTSDEHGDRPRPLPKIPELKKATDVSDRKDSPSWDYDAEKERWVWKKPPPISKKQVSMGNSEERKQMRKEIRAAQQMTVKEKLLNEFRCSLCKDVMKFPLTTPCAHNFCKACLEAKFSGKAFTRDRACHSGRTLRVQKNVMECPACRTDISDFLQNPQVNRDLMDVIEKLQSREECKNDDIKEDEGCSEAELSNGENDENKGCKRERKKLQSGEEECKNDDIKEDEGCSEAELSNGENDENKGCKRKESETDEKPVSTPKRKKIEIEDELPEVEALDIEESSDILSEKESPHADGATEEAGRKRKPEAVTEKPKKRIKRKKTKAKDELLENKENVEAEEKVDEVASPVAKGIAKRVNKKTETKAEIAKVDEEKIAEKKVDENGEIEEEKVDGGDKVEAAAVAVKRRGRKASVVKENAAAVGVRRGRSASKGGV